MAMASLFVRLGRLESRNAVQKYCDVVWKRERFPQPSRTSGRKEIWGKRWYGEDAMGLGSDWSNVNHKDRMENKTEGVNSERKDEIDESGKDSHTFRPFGSDSSDEPVTDNVVHFGPTEDEYWQRAEQGNEIDDEEYVESFDESLDILNRVSQYALIDIDYAAKLERAIEEKQPNLCARCLFAASRAGDLDFLKAIPADSFSKIIDLLQPQKFLSQLVDLHMDLSRGNVASLKTMPIFRVVQEYNVVMGILLDITRNAGRKLSLMDYECLLDGANQLHLRGWALKLWQGLHDDGHTPTTKCYNGYMGAVMWERGINASHRFNDRVLPQRILWRQAKVLRNMFGFRTRQGGIRAIVGRVFEEMLSTGAVADEESFCTLIKASALEGEIEGVKQILSKVWNIDTDAVSASRDTPPRAIPSESTLYPTDKLLSCVAHAFGVNNDIITGIKLVEFIARHYGLEISEKTWSTILEWAFVLSCRRDPLDFARGETVGQVEPSAVLSVWAAMTAKPHGIELTMSMLDRMVRFMEWNGSVFEMLRIMEDGREHWQESKRDSVLTHRTYTRLVEQKKKGLPIEEPLEVAGKRWDIAKLKEVRDRVKLGRWVRCFLKAAGRAAAHDYDQYISTVLVPTILHEWSRFTPRSISYRGTTGYVQIELAPSEEVRDTRQDIAFYAVGRLRAHAKSGRVIDGKWGYLARPPPRKARVDMTELSQEIAGEEQQSSDDETQVLPFRKHESSSILRELSISKIEGSSHDER